MLSVRVLYEGILSIILGYKYIRVLGYYISVLYSGIRV